MEHGNGKKGRLGIDLLFAHLSNLFGAQAIWSLCRSALARPGGSNTTHKTQSFQVARDETVRAERARQQASQITTLFNAKTQNIKVKRIKAHSAPAGAAKGGGDTDLLPIGRWPQVKVSRRVSRSEQLVAPGADRTYSGGARAGGRRRPSGWCGGWVRRQRRRRPRAARSSNNIGARSLDTGDWALFAARWCRQSARAEPLRCCHTAPPAPPGNSAHPCCPCDLTRIHPRLTLCALFGSACT